MSKSQLLHRGIDASNDLFPSAHLSGKIRTAWGLNIQNAASRYHHYLTEPRNRKSNVSEFHGRLSRNNESPDISSCRRDRSMRQIPATNPVCCMMRRKWPALVFSCYRADGQVRLLHHLSQSNARTMNTINHRTTALNDGQIHPPPKQRSTELEIRAAETLHGAATPYTFHNLHSAVQPFPNNFLKRSARPLIPPTPPCPRTFLERSSSSARAPTPLTPDAYHGLADKFFHNLIRRLEALQEERDDVDSDYSVRFNPAIVPLPPLQRVPDFSFFPIVQNQLTACFS